MHGLVNLVPEYSIPSHCYCFNFIKLTSLLTACYGTLNWWRRFATEPTPWTDSLYSTCKLSYVHEFHYSLTECANCTLLNVHVYMRWMVLLNTLFLSPMDIGQPTLANGHELSILKVCVMSWAEKLFYYTWIFITKDKGQRIHPVNDSGSKQWLDKHVHLIYPQKLTSIVETQIRFL